MKVFVSFDFDHDRLYKYLLEAWSENKNIRFSFEDKSSREINTNNIGRVKAALTAKIREADCLLAVIGKYSNSKHRDSDLIGYRNWQAFEIAKANEAGLKIVAVKLDKTFVGPNEIYNSGCSWAYSYTLDSIIDALYK